MIHFPKRTVIKLLSVIAVSALCFSLMASLIYRYDNKYTRRTLQPIGGLLALSEKDLQENACYFLAEGWSFYPDKLFTPETFAEEGAQSFAQIITIGQYNDFSFGQPQRGTNGSATYRLLLSLPQTPYTYSLALPEVFSSYRLYIGGTLISNWGIPHQSIIGRRSMSRSSLLRPPAQRKCSWPCQTTPTITAGLPTLLFLAGRLM